MTSVNSTLLKKNNIIHRLNCTDYVEAYDKSSTCVATDNYSTYEL